MYPDKINIDSSGVTAEEGAMAPFRGQKNIYKAIKFNLAICYLFSLFFCLSVL